MNKAQFVEQLAKKIQLPKKQTESFLDSALEIIQTTVAKGDEVKIVGFGTFDQSLRKARNGHNPQTGDKILIPETCIPRFRAGKEFKNSVGRSRH